MEEISFEHVILSEGSSFLIRYDVEHQSDPLLYHRHPELEIQYIHRGRGQHILGGIIENAEEGDIVLVPANVPHLWVYDYPTPDYQVQEYCIQFKLEVVTEMMNVFPEFDECAEYFGKLKDALEIKGPTAAKIRQQMLQMSTRGRVQRLLLLLQILNEIQQSSDIRYINLGHQEAVRTKGMTMIQKTFAYMITHLSQDISLNEAAAEVNMSPNTFCNFFKKNAGKTFTFALNELRINKATTLLTNNKDMSISQVAYEVGYNTIAHFNHVFQKMKGCSPKQYRLKYGKE